MSLHVRYWLKPAEGPALLIPARGLLLGRAPECDVVLSDRKASKHHALVRPSLEGLDLFALGRNPTRCSGRVVERYARLEERDRLELPGGSWQIAVEGRGDPVAIWQLAVSGGGRYGLRWLPFCVGGGLDDDLLIERWPPRALCFVQAGGTLAAELGVALQISGKAAPRGALDLPDHGRRYERDGVTLTLLAAARTAGVQRRHELPVRARFTLLSGGGRLTLELPDRRIRQVVLEPPRGRLIAALLSPPSGYRAGQWLPDEVLIAAIWPGERRGRAELNQLLHQTRRDLVRAGIDPALLERARRGGGTRLALDEGVLVEVR